MILFVACMGVVVLFLFCIYVSMFACIYKVKLALQLSTSGYVLLSLAIIGCLWRAGSSHVTRDKCRPLHI